jgi:MFS family permease
MLLTGLIAIGTYALPAIAGLLLIVVVVEMGSGWAWPVYIAVSILSVLLAGDKEAVMMYILFFGYYPVLKANIEKTRMKYLTWILKFAVFNVSMIACYYISITILGVPEESFTIRGLYLPWVFLAVGNMTFLIYDFAISSLVLAYYQRFHKLVNGMLGSMRFKRK